MNKEEKMQKNEAKSQLKFGNEQNLAGKLQKKRELSQITGEIIEGKKQAFRSFFFKGYNDYDIYVRAWDNVDKPQAVILITHGMVEHGLRYDGFAKFLNSKKYIVVIPDIRSHGKTAGAPDMVGQCEGDLFDEIVKDNIKLSDTLISYYKLPLILLGHSYGSFITQCVIENYQQHAAAILVGSASFKGRVDAKAGKVIAKITRLFKGKNAKAKLIFKITFGSYGKGKENGNWLTNDTDIFNQYNADPYCGGMCTAQFYCSFFEHLTQLHKKENLKNIDKKKPILITSGELDPVGGKKHKMVDSLFKQYKKENIEDVTYKLWAGGLHEILNETFRQEVYEYIADWINKRI